VSAANLFRELVIAVLRGNAEVVSLVENRSYDQPPDRTEPPYIYLGPINRQRLEIGCGSAATLRMRIYAVSIEFGREGAWKVADAIWDALDGAEPAPDQNNPFRLQGAFEVLQAGDVLEPLSPKSAFVDLTATFAKA
jgi:hypothetical protein